MICLRRMKAGEFPDGTRVLRAKIDMASPNLNMRDPVMYRILARGAPSHRRQVVHLSACMISRTASQTRWKTSRTPCARWSLKITVLYITGSSRSWAFSLRSRLEFDRLNLTYTLLSKRKLLQLVQEKRVSGWDDPRMPTLERHPPPRLYARGAAEFCGEHRRDQDQWHA